MLAKIKNLLLLAYYFVRLLSFYLPDLLRAKWAVRKGEMNRAREILYHDAASKLFRMIDIRLDIRGNAEVPTTDRTVIYISNHPGMLDIPVLFRVIHLNTRMLYSYEVAEFPFPGFRWILKTFGHLPISNKRDEQLKIDLERINEEMDKGGYYWAAPEGGLQSKGLAPFKKTVFHMAKEHQALVVPICIKGSGDIIAQAQNWFSVEIYHGRTIHCTILPVIDANQYEDVNGLWEASYTAIRLSTHQ